MYSVPVIGAMVMGLDGNAIGLVHSIEHTVNGVTVFVHTGDDDEPHTPERALDPETVRRLRCVGEDK